MTLNNFIRFLQTIPTEHANRNVFVSIEGGLCVEEPIALWRLDSDGVLILETSASTTEAERATVTV